MEEIFKAITARLQKTVPELKWIDLDTGQLENYTDRPPVAFPCALIDIELTRCEDLYPGAQLCNATVAIRIAQAPPTNRTNSSASKTVQQSELQRYHLIEHVYRSLQSWESGIFNPLSRTAQKKEARQDPLFIVKIDFATMFKQS